MYLPAPLRHAATRKEPDGPRISCQPLSEKGLPVPVELNDRVTYQAVSLFRLQKIIKKHLIPVGIRCFFWLRGQDLNLRPSGYEPDELPAAPPRDNFCCLYSIAYFQSNCKTFFHFSDLFLILPPFISICPIPFFMRHCLKNFRQCLLCLLFLMVY